MRKMLSLFVVFALLMSFLAAVPVRADGVTLVILTRHDTTIQELAKEAFLKSDIAKQYNIVDIKFRKAPESQWKIFIERGQADIGWGGGPTLFDNL